MLTDNGIAFADLPKLDRFLVGRPCLRLHLRRQRHHSQADEQYHHLTNGQAERMHRTIKDATLKVYHYPDIESLKVHVLAFVKN